MPQIGDRVVSACLARVAPMSEHRVTPPESYEGLRGPATYFPSIEKTYGRPIQEWLDLVADQLDTKKHMEVVEHLKSEYGLGHGHAQSLVAYTKAQLQA